MFLGSYPVILIKKNKGITKNYAAVIQFVV